MVIFLLLPIHLQFVESVCYKRCVSLTHPLTNSGKKFDGTSRCTGERKIVIHKVLDVRKNLKKKFICLGIEKIQKHPCYLLSITEKQLIGSRQFSSSMWPKQAESTPDTINRTVNVSKISDFNLLLLFLKTDFFHCLPLA